jgi:hypothetical protein
MKTLMKTQMIYREMLYGARILAKLDYNARALKMAPQALRAMAQDPA